MTDIAKRAPHAGNKPLVLPQSWHHTYTDDDKRAVIRIINWLEETNRAKAWMSVAASIHRSTLTEILKGKYSGIKPARLKQMLEVIEGVEARAKTVDTPFIPTTVSRVVEAGCNRARNARRFAIIAANVGTGKTRALKEYARSHSHTYLVEADPDMSPGALLEDLIDVMEIGQLSTSATQRRLFRTVVKALSDRQNALIILDESETTNSKTLEVLRRISDKSGTGVVLAGTPRLYSLISPNGGQFDQIRSRSPFFPKPIYAITMADTLAILTASFDDCPGMFVEREVTVKDDDASHVETDMVFDPALAKRIMGYTQGSMRVLVENMIPALRTIGLKEEGGITIKTIDKIAKEVLSLELFDVH